MERLTFLGQERALVGSSRKTGNQLQVFRDSRGKADAQTDAAFFSLIAPGRLPVMVDLLRRPKD